VSASDEVRDEALRALRIILRPQEASRVFRGAITAADADGARVEPWHRSVTVDAPTGEGRARLAPIVKRTPRERAEQLALRFVAHLEARARQLGRPVTPADLSDEEYRAFGAELWREGEPVDVETLRRVAGMYLDAVQRGSSGDARFAVGRTR
jgi:hypothetical protein